nr:hypothetical protein pmam_284 [Pithovirus mammoth]
MELKRKLYQETKEQIQDFEKRLIFLKKFEESFTLDIPLTLAICENGWKVKVGFPVAKENFDEWEQPEDITQWILSKIPEFLAPLVEKFEIRSRTCYSNFPLYSPNRLGKEIPGVCFKLNGSHKRFYFQTLKTCDGIDVGFVNLTQYLNDCFRQILR